MTQVVSDEKLHEFYFEQGDTVVLRHIPGPDMIVLNKIMANHDEARGSTKKKLVQVECGWFNKEDQWCTESYDYLNLQITKRARWAPRAYAPQKPATV